MTKPGKPARPISRREFARRGALAAASAACLPVVLLPEASAQVASGTPAETPALSTTGQAEVDAKVAAILRQYGQLLSDAEKLDVRRLVTEGQKPLETMRAFPLDDSNQPGNVLKLYPDAAPPPAAPSQKAGKK